MPLVPPAGPLRVLSVATFVNTFGNGLYFTISVVFFTRSVGLSAYQVGLGLTIAGLLGLLAGIPFGHLADRRGARETLVALMLAEGLAAAGLVLVRSFPAFLLVASLFTVLDRAANGVRQGLIAGAFSPADRVRGRAYLRSVTNLGLGLGALLAGVALQVDTRSAYVSLIVADALTYGVAALLLLRLPRSLPASAPPGGMLLALRDRTFVAVTVLNAVISLHYVLLEVGLPLWILHSTSAPRWTVALVFLVNTLCCVLFQVRASRPAVDVRSSAAVVRRGSLLVAASCLLFSLSSGRSPVVAVAVLVVAALVHVTGELLHAAGSWGLGFGLAPEHAQGQYQGLFSTGFAAAGMVGPLIITVTVIQHGTAGWMFLGLLVAGAGALLVPLVAVAERNRSAVAQPAPAG